MIENLSPCRQRLWILTFKESRKTLPQNISNGGGLPKEEKYQKKTRKLQSISVLSLMMFPFWDLVHQMLLRC
jgi:hypothetical protein